MTEGSSPRGDEIVLVRLTRHYSLSLSRFSLVEVSGLAFGVPKEKKKERNMSRILALAFLWVYLIVSVQSFHLSTPRVVGRSSISSRVLSKAVASHHHRLASSVQNEAFTDIPSLSTKGVLQIENEDQFTKYIENGKGAAMVDFYADWCGPCKVRSVKSLNIFSSFIHLPLSFFLDDCSNVFGTCEGFDARSFVEQSKCG